MVDFKPYPRSPHYIVGNDGSIWNSIFRNGTTLHVLGRPRQLAMSPSKGYLTVTICNNGKRFCGKVHAMVLEAFVGQKPVKHEGAHWDGNRKNNHIGNLRWTTVKENNHDKYRHGTMLMGSSNGRSVLTEADVCYLRKSKDSATALSSKLGVAINTICDIRKGRTWRHIL